MNNSTTIVPASNSAYADSVQLQSILNSINYFGSLFVLIPLFVLNLIASAVFMRKRFWQKTTMGFYYSLHPLFSNGTVFIGILTFYTSAIKLDFAATSYFVCVAYWLVRGTLYYFPGYYQLLISVDRMIHVLYPRKFPLLEKPRYLAIIIAVLMIINIGFVFPQFNRTIVYSASMDSKTCVYA